MNTVIVNGNSFSIVGNDISITNGKIFVDGNDYTPETKTINIQIHGDIKNFQSDYSSSIKVVGNVEDLSSTNGDISVEGNVGSISSTNGDIDCDDVGGNVKTVNGDIKYKGTNDRR